MGLNLNIIFCAPGCQREEVFVLLE